MFFENIARGIAVHYDHYKAAMFLKTHGFPFFMTRCILLGGK